MMERGKRAGAGRPAARLEDEEYESNGQPPPVPQCAVGSRCSIMGPTKGLIVPGEGEDTQHLRPA